MLCFLYQQKISNFEKNSKILGNILKEMENISNKINEEKERIKIKIQKIFTEIRNAINLREDELFEEIDKRFDEIYFNENVINDNKILENEMKEYLKKNKEININNLEINKFIHELDTLKNKCDIIENKIKELSILNKKGNNKINIEFKAEPGGVGSILKKIRNYGDIYINENNGLKIYKCFNNNHGDNNVLLISNQKFEMIHNLLKINEKINNISIFSPNFIPNLIYQDNFKYKIIIFDFQDAGYEIKKDNIEEIKKYLESGGNIIITHDHWTLLEIQGNSAICSSLLKAKLISRLGANKSKARILNNSHPIFNSYYNLNFQKNDLIEIAETHRSCTTYDDMKEYLNDLLIELDDDEHGEYLLIKEIGKGRLIYWNAGHLYREIGSFRNITEVEQKIFMNIIYWIYE